MTALSMQEALPTPNAVKSFASQQALTCSPYAAPVRAKKAASSANEMAREREQALEVDADEGDSDAPVIKLLDNLLARAFSMNASDIHIEPFEEKTSVRIRVDGQLLDYVVLQKSLHQNLIARVKILGQMDIAEKMTSAGRSFSDKNRKPRCQYSYISDSDCIWRKGRASSFSFWKYGGRCRDVWHESGTF